MLKKTPLHVVATIWSICTKSPPLNRGRRRRGHDPTVHTRHRQRWSGFDDGLDRLLATATGRISALGRTSTVAVVVVVMLIRAETVADVVDPVDVVILALVGRGWPLDGGRSGGTVHEEGLIQGEVERGFGFVALQVEDRVDRVLHLAADVLVKVEPGGVAGAVKVVHLVEMVLEVGGGGVMSRRRLDGCVMGGG